MIGAPLALAVLLALPGPRPPGDRWFSEDKLRHFFASFVVTSITASAARAAGLDAKASMWTGAGVGAAVGTVKEIRDLATRRGTPSLRDLTWDLAGVVSAAAVVRQVQ